MFDGYSLPIYLYYMFALISYWLWVNMLVKSKHSCDNISLAIVNCALSISMNSRNLMGQSQPSKPLSFFEV